MRGDRRRGKVNDIVCEQLKKELKLNKLRCVNSWSAQPGKRSLDLSVSGVVETELTISQFFFAHVVFFLSM